MAANDPPPSPVVVGGDTKAGKVSPQKISDPYGLGVTGTGTFLGDTPIAGSQNFFFGDRGFDTVAVGGDKKGRYGTVLKRAKARSPLTATDTITAFIHADPYKLAQIQSQMYRAGGYYPASYVPTYGKLRQEDIAAFRSFIVGLAANPAQGKLGDYLAGVADDGDKAGVNNRTRAPLVIKLTSPDDLRAVIQNTARDLYGGNLPEEDVQRLIGAYNGLESTAQTNAYNMGDPNLTGTTDGGVGGTVVKAPDLTAFAQERIKQAHPEQVAATQFGATLDTILSTLTTSRVGGQQ